MPDPINQTMPPTTPPVTPSAEPTLPNPQDLVNEALGTPAASPTIEAPQPKPALEQPLPPPLQPLGDATPQPIESSTIAPPPLPPSPTPSTPNITMGDDTPLAFAATAPTITPTQPEPATTPAPTSTPIPEVAPLPPVPSSPSTAPKPKKKAGMMIALMLFLLVGLGGGIYTYSMYGSPLTINKIIPECGDGEALTAGGECKKLPASKAPTTSKPPASKPPASKAPTTSKAPTPSVKASPAAGEFGYNYTTGKPSTSADWNDPNANIAGTYVQNGKRYIINIPSTQNAALKYNIESGGNLNGKITSNGQTLVFPQNMSIDEYNAMVAAGKTWAPPGVGCNDMPGRLDPNNKNDGSDKMGGEAAVGCTIWHWTTCTNKGTGVNGVGCDVLPKTTGDNPGDNPNPSPSSSTTTPTLACTGITRTPTTDTVAMGTTVTLTCAGTVTPPSAATLSYKFRYSINGGATTTLANKTATTAELTVTACGSYSVQCQACATLNGVLTCNPTWTGATQ